MVAGRRIDDSAVNDLLNPVVVVIAHNAGFDRRFLEKRLTGFSTKHWACSRFDIDWKAEGIRSSALEFVAYSLGFFHDGHRAASDCRTTIHALAQRLPGTGRLALQALLEQARLLTGQGTPQSKRRICSRPEGTVGVQEKPGVRNAGAEMCQTPIRPQRWLGAGQI
jgi:DNA polymerase III epsilon subunit-like protein